MSKEIEYRRERMNLIKRMREILDQADKDGKIDGAQDEEFRRLEARVVELDELIHREERVRELERSVEGSLAEVPVATSKEERTVDPRATEEYRSAFYNWVRSGRRDIEARELYKGSDPAGGYLVPVALEAKVIELASESSIIRKLGEVVTSSTDVKIPVEASIPTFSFVAERGSYSEASGTLDIVQLEAHKAGGIVKVSEELLADAAVDLEAYLARQFARAQAALENAKFVNGSGSGEPRGLLADADTGVTTAANNAITMDELKELIFSLDDTYAQKAAMLMHSTTALAIALLKDDTGAYYWSEREQATRPRTLLGFPVYTLSTMPTIQASAKVIAFGDFSFYRIQDRLGMTVLKLVERYADTGMVGFRPTFRTDGSLLLGEAVKLLVMHS